MSDELTTRLRRWDAPGRHLMGAAADRIASLETERDAWFRMYVSSVDRHHALIASIIRKVNEGGDLGAVVRHVAEHLDNIDAIGADADLDGELFDAIARTDPRSLPARLDPEDGER